MVCDVLSMLCINCNNVCNNVSVLCLHVIVTDYVLIGEIAGNKHPVLLLLLLFKYLGATLTETWMRRWRIQYNQIGKNWKRGYWMFCVVE